MLMRAALLSGLFVSVALFPGGARAQVVCLNCFDELTGVAENVVTAANWVTQLDRMTAQIQQQILIFQQLSGLTNVNAMVAVLNQAGNFNQMGSFGNVPAQLMGAGGGIGAGYQAANGNALPVGSPMPFLNAVSEVFNQRAGSLASVQAISATMLTNSNVILNGLMQLQHLIDQQPSSQLMGGMNARLASYQGNINAQQYQLAQMQTFANAQQQVFDQKIQQAAYCADAGWAADNPSLTGAALNLGAAHCGGGAGGVPGTVPVAGGGGAPVAGAGGGAETAGFDTPLPPIPPDVAVAVN